MAEVGSAYIAILPSARGFKSKLMGEIGGDLDGAGRDAGDRFGSGFVGKLGKLGIAAGAGLAAGVVGAAVKGVGDFAAFQGQMQEVFTLLPGISGTAMDAMTGQVKDFSKEFGVLPDDVVPALYQSLSAGVPQDNVFEFLETAQQAAKGGVTELETAVDGISSVVNAYGDDVIDAAGASDLMFTAVRLGKTNFEELSSSLSNVTPIASGLGVKFEDVSAGLAAMTAKGTPTAQATTQLRSLFVELSKAGGETAKVFEEAAGQSFQEFIAAGGDTAGALDIMAGAADASGMQIQDLFGSVEAGSAALSLTSGTGFTDALGEMGNAAGATQTAFETMDQGIGPVFDRLRAAGSVALIDIGDKLAPVVEKVGTFALDALPRLGDAFTHAAAVIGPVVASIAATVGPILGQIGGAIDHVAGLWRSNSDQIGTTTSGLMAQIAPILGQITATFRSMIDAVTAIVRAGTQLVTGIWDRFGGGILASIGRYVGNLIQIFKGALNVVQGVFEIFAGLFTGDWSRLWGGVQQVFSGAWNIVQGIFRNAVEVIRTAFGIFTAAIQSLWSGLWGKVGDRLSAAWTSITDGVSSGVSSVVTFFTELPDRIFDALAGLGQRMLDFGGDLIAGFARGIRNGAGAIISAIRSAITDKLPSFVKTALGIRSPSRLFAELGRQTVAGFAKGLLGEASTARSAMNDVLETVTRTASLGSVGVAATVNTSPAPAAASMPRALTLRIGDREFTAYVDERADGVVSSRNRQLLGRVAAGVR